MKQTKTVALLIAGGVLLLAIASLVETHVWDGGFRQAEYQLTLVDRAGKPVPGVELRVEGESGANFYHYPVTDYSPNSTLASNDKGVLTFHHVKLGGLEFGGKCSELFWIIPIGECNSPIFVCRFVADGKEIYRCKFNDLRSIATEGSEPITRTWNWLDCLPCSSGKEAMDWYKREHAGRDKDKNGTVDMAERAAMNETMVVAEKCQDIERRTVPASEELEFAVFRQTIVVD